MDDDVVSLIGLTLIDSKRRFINLASMHQLSFCLYLMTQCQVKLHYSMTSLVQTLDYTAVARRELHERCALVHFTLDQLLLKLIERKILLYISRELV